MEDADNWRDASPWHPMTKQIDLKHLEKLGEEAGELVSAICRCLAQGIDEAHPVTGKINRDWFQDEIADVTAGIMLNIAHFKLDEEAIATRALRKMEHLRGWHAGAETPPVAYSYEIPVGEKYVGGRWTEPSHWVTVVKLASALGPEGPTGASIRNIRALR